MNRKSAKLVHPCAVACVLTALGLATPGYAAGSSDAPAGQATAAQAPGTQIAQAAAQSLHMMHQAGELGVLSQAMTFHALLYALTIEPDENIRELLAAYETFGRIVTGLRHGDEGLNLTGTENPKILAKLTELEGHWADFGPAISGVLESGKATQVEIETIAEASQPMFRASDEFAEIVAYHATGGQTFSVLTETVARAERQSALINQMLTHYLLVALDYRARRNQQALTLSTAEFERVLNGLIKGDSELKVLKAPSRAIGDQYRIVQGLWADFMPLVTAATVSGETEPSVIEEVHQLGMELSREMDEAVELYAKL